jgi:DNA repair protein RecN (Recombination protein N)
MLVELVVTDLAVIKQARLELGPGLNVLTGETGAGKSMLVDALALLLGERASGDLVRPGAPRAVVEGVFETAKAGGQAVGRSGGQRAVVEGEFELGPSVRRSVGPSVHRILSDLGIEFEDGRIILKREVKAAGGSRAWINGSPVTAGVLADVGRLLIDLHGQHETQSLVRAEAQRELLDAFAGAEAIAAGVRTAYDAWRTVVEERRVLAGRQAEARKRADYLRHVAEEIRRAAPKDGEMEQLESDVRRLTHAEELRRTADDLAELLDGDDRSAEHAIGQAGRLLDALERIDAAGAQGWQEMLEAARVNVKELARAVRDYAAGIEADPARLAAVEKRRDLLFQLDRKYGPGLDRVRATGDEARREIEMLDTAGADLAELDQRGDVARAAFLEQCRTLTAKRKSAARKLGVAVSKHLAALGMADGRLTVQLEERTEPDGTGAEAVEFLAELNPGMGARPLARAASGGELSRVMLALKVELAAHDAVPTLVFDEVDQGVGGHVAGRVAAALTGVAGEHQVLVITHLPQIAAAAARQLVVRKATTGGAAVTTVEAVEAGDRVDEIARMLGGATATARRHAAELLGAPQTP